MLSLADLIKVISPVEKFEVFDINTNITYNPRIEEMPKEWIEYEVQHIYSVMEVEDSYTIISVKEVNHA